MMLYKYLQAIRKEKRHLANLYYGAFPDVSPDVKEFHALHKIARRSDLGLQIADRLKNILVGDTYWAYLD